MNKLLPSATLASLVILALPLAASARSEESKTTNLSNMIVIRSSEELDKPQTEPPEIFIMNVDQIPKLADGKVDVEALGNTCMALESNAQKVVLRPIPAEVMQAFQNADAEEGALPARVANVMPNLRLGGWRFYYDFGSGRAVFGYGQPNYYHYGYGRPYYPLYGFYDQNRLYPYQPYGYRYYGGRHYSYYGRP